MQDVIYLMLRRMRLPLIVLIVTYSVAILGFTLIPGVDDQGNPWRMDFFHAFYFVSFLGSTIGFGEIPYPFTTAQRLWTTFTIYLAVVSWLYAIGSILTLIQDTGFRRVLAYSGFTRSVRRIQKPFYIICGYGDASSLLVREMSVRGMACVVVERDQEKILGLQVEDLPDNVPGLAADATETNVLIAAGLRRPNCAGVIALTGSDHHNLTIAISSKLLAPHLPVMCQSDSKDAAANMGSFGTDHIIDPFEIFASRFAMMFHSPSMFLVYAWMTAVHNQPLSEFREPPAGSYVLCGFGRFGKAVREHLIREGLDIKLIEADVDRTDAPLNTVEGRGTEADTLLAADLESASGVIAGTDNDTNNLSILITARDLKHELFTVGRQNLKRNDALFKAADIDVIMQPGTIVAQTILGLILAPLLDDFLRLAHDKDEEWANLLVSRVAGLVEKVAPDTWDLIISPISAPSVFDCLIRNEEVRLQDLCADPRNRDDTLPCVPLLLKREDEEILLPEMSEALRSGDRLLLCGKQEARRHMEHTLYDHRALLYTRTGIDRPDGALWRLLTGSGRESCKPGTS